MFSRHATIATTFFLAACASAGVRTNTAMVASDQAAIVSLCTIADNPEPYLGRVTRVLARYSIVKHYDSFFSGLNCTGQSIVAEGSRKDSDNSVADFSRAGDRLCKARNIESLCTLKADMVVVARIRIDDDGELVADPIHVESFNYLPAEEVGDR